MNYPVSANSVVGRSDNLFNLLSANELSVQEYERINGKAPGIPLRQAFMSASQAFHVIETATRGVVVPYGVEGRKLIDKLCSSRELDKQYKLIKKAQRYSVNVFLNVLEKLVSQGAVHEVQKGAGILFLDERYYSNKFGLSENRVSEMNFLNG
jgi:CRISPR-associated endonuclease/helicase Cas3